jgi:hypothetical protein
MKGTAAFEGILRAARAQEKGERSKKWPNDTGWSPDWSW